MASKNTQYNLTIKVNGKDVKNTLNGVGKELRSLRQKTKNIEQGTEEWYKANKELAKTEKIYADMKANQRELLEETKKNISATEDQNEALSDFGDNLGQVFTAIKTGNLAGLRAGMYGIAGGIKAATRAGLAFIGTPIGATIAGLAIVATATKRWYDYNKAISKTIKLTEQLTGYDGKRLSDFRASIQATSDTFDKEYNEVLRSANALSKQMGIAQEEALDLINQGLVRGADAQGDFLEKVREYPVQFKNAGYSAQDFIDIATQEATGGVFNDKLVDAIKEADLSFKEFTKTQRDALENAYGKKFADELSAGLESGKTTTAEAINLIMKKSDEMGVNFQQKQQLVADVFKGAGEDAGGFEEILHQINQAFDEENKKLNENEKATQRLVDANTEYEKALADLFDASKSGFPAIITQIKAVGTEIYSNILVGIRKTITSLETLEKEAAKKGQSQAVKRVVENSEKFGTDIAEEAQMQIRATEKNIERLTKKIQKEEKKWFGKEDSYKEQLAKQKAYLEELKSITKGESEELNKYLEDIKNPSSSTSSSSGKKSDEEEEKKRKKAAENKKQKELERIKAFEEEKQNLLNEIELQKAESDKEKEELKAEQDYEKRQKDLEELELNETEKNDLEALLKESHEQRLLQIQEKYNAKKQKENQKLIDGLIAAENNLQAAKENAQKQGLSAFASVFSETSEMYKALFLFEKGLAAGEVVTNAAKGIAAAKANLALVPPVIGAFPNPMYAVAAATTAKDILATKITAATQLGVIAAQTIKGFAVGGYTDMFGTGYRDNTGQEVAGVVHKDEYVVPRFVRKDPEVPQILGYLEQKRKKKLGLYADGGYAEEGSFDGNTPTASFSDFSRMENLLEQLIVAQYENREILFGPEAEIKRQEQEKKIRKIQDNAKVKK